MDNQITPGQYVVQVDSTGHVTGAPIPYSPSTIGFDVNFWIGFVLFIIIALVALKTCFFTVKQQSVKIIQRFGKFKKVGQTGFNFKAPFIDKIAGEIDLRNQQIVTNAETKTQDNVFVTLQVATQYFIEPDKAEKAFYKLDNVKEQMTAYILDVVRGQVPKLKLDEVFEKKDDIATAIKEELGETFSGFGFEILSSLIIAVEPEQSVKNAMNEINTQARLREAANSKAEADKIIAIKKAEAESESKILQGKGIAGQRQAIVDGLKASVKDMSDATGINSAEVMQTILLTQYFDTLTTLGGSNTKVVFIDPSPKGLSDIAGGIKNAMMSAEEAK